VVLACSIPHPAVVASAVHRVSRAGLAVAAPAATRACAGSGCSGPAPKPARLAPTAQRGMRMKEASAAAQGSCAPAPRATLMASLPMEPVLNQELAMVLVAAPMLQCWVPERVVANRSRNHPRPRTHRLGREAFWRRPSPPAWLWLGARTRQQRGQREHLQWRRRRRLEVPSLDSACRTLQLPPHYRLQPLMVAAAHPLPASLGQAVNVPLAKRRAALRRWWSACHRRLPWWQAPTHLR
jgi:hypothetical protein